MTQQLVFDLPAKPALGREDFFVSPSNAMAVGIVGDWVQWPAGKLALIGPVGSGKTHLAHVWAAETGARIITADRLARADIDALAQTSVAVENIAQQAGNRGCEEALFHLHNLTLANGHRLLLTATTPPSRWNLTLPDLASRMQGTAVTMLQTPDDNLLMAVLVKLFADRQLSIQPSVIEYLVKRMDRSFEQAQQMVDALDKAALAKGRAITRPLAAEVLDKITQDTA